MIDGQIDRVASSLHDRWKVARIAAGHCTGEPGFAVRQRTFGGRYIDAGLGKVIPLP